MASLLKRTHSSLDDRRVKLNFEIKFNFVEEDAFKSRLSDVRDLLTLPGSRTMDNLSLIPELFDCKQNRTDSRDPDGSVVDHSTFHFCEIVVSYGTFEECVQHLSYVWLQGYIYHPGLLIRSHSFSVKGVVSLIF